MDDEATLQLAAQVMGALGGGGPSEWPAGGGISGRARQGDVGNQYLVASLRHGYFSADPIAVAFDGRIDVDYGKPGPEISPQQQLTSSGYLSAAAGSGESDKQARYRLLCMFPSMPGPMGEELQALKDDEDVHSVSVISGGQDTDAEHFSPCAVDCWLKRRRAEPAVPRDPRPSLYGRRWDPSAQPGGEKRRDIYSPLAASHIRILCLEPGSYGDEISCSLTARPCAAASPGDPAAEHAAYEALSYTWGDPTLQFSVRCNGQTLPAAHNLFLALQHLRHQSARRYLWVDAICINQNDLDEKNTQIPHMLNIYRGATRVLVWLGVESETSPLAVDSMKALDQPSERRGVMLRSHERGCYEQLRAVCDALGKLLERPWFTRSWIRQELSVGKDVVLLCGRDSFGWYTLKRSAARLGHFRHKLAKEAGIVAPGPQGTRNDDPPIPYLAHGWTCGQPVTKLIGSIRSVWYYHAGGLLDLLMTSRQFDATDPRDKVYAVLGLGRVPMRTGRRPTEEERRGDGGGGVPSFPVDYAKSVSEVYQDTVKYFVNRDRNLDILTLLLTARNARSFHDLPSWAPDWRVPASEVSVTQHWDSTPTKFAASGLHSQAEPQDHGETGVLRCKGYAIDRIGTRLDCTADVCDMLDTGDDDPAPGNEEARAIGEGQSQPPALAVREFDPSTDRTQCFETAEGLVCLAPAEARPGDEIAVLLGGKPAFVVRPRFRVTRTADHAPPFYYQMVGPCVLPEAMFGAAVKFFAEREVARSFVLM